MLSQLKKYLITKYGIDAVNTAFHDIKKLVLKTL